MTRAASAPPLVDDEARHRIRHDLGTTFIVEAAAGTGKTTELIHRIVHVIATGVATVDRIVSVTFTEKAAGELKLRLREALEKARNAEAAPPKGALGTAHVPRRVHHLEHALAHLEEARVGTIHAFCAELLRERPVEARIDPKFEVLLETESERVFGEVFDLWLQQALEGAPEGVRRSLRRRSSFGDEEREPTTRLKLAAWQLVEWRDFTAPWRRDRFDREALIDGIVQQLHDFAALTEGPASPRDNLYHDSRDGRRISRGIRDVERIRGRDYDDLEATIVSISKDRDFKNVRKGYGSTYKEGVSRSDVLAAHAELIARMEAFARAADADLAAVLREELSEVLDGYREAKERRGHVDFVDLLIRARDLLRDNQSVRTDFQQRISNIFVDEFQDTDPLQAEILLLLSADVPGKLFIVGDPKQSIYRFRRADVGIYEDVKRRLVAHGAECLTLTTSFRSVPSLQRLVNAAFAPVMTGDRDLLQADYVPLSPFRPERGERPSVVVLPVPRPYGKRKVAMAPIEESLPEAVGAFVAWVVNESGWGFSERDVCILLRRFEKFGADTTRPYVQALESRGIPHLLVGGKSFHQREEVETLRAALCATEWPDDELSVFATLHGSLFAIPDELLYEYRHRSAQFHPFRIPKELEATEGDSAGSVHFSPIVQALSLLQGLHRRRNYVPVTETIGRLLEETRAHAGFVMRPSGEQVLANVLQIGELARRYEVSGGISFRGFVEQLREEADAATVGEAPILEEGSDGVRIMTVHKAKGLEFPVVILADMTANLAHQHASRHIDQERGLSALRIAGWSPADLLEHEAREVARDRAEGLRIAYVAATRARDLLVVPAIGDEPYENKWVSVLNPAVYPLVDRRRSPDPPPGGLTFGRDTVLDRPGGDPAGPQTVAPGLYGFEAPGSPYSVLWWDPKYLTLEAPPSFGIRQQELIGKETSRAVVDADLRMYNDWREHRAAVLASGAQPSMIAQTVTERAAKAAGSEEGAAEVDIIEITRDPDRPSGPRFGALVHAVLATVALDPDSRAVEAQARLHGRLLGGTDREIESTARVVVGFLLHPLADRARRAQRAGRLRREVPLAWHEESGSIVEGTADLVLEEGDAWLVVDFKTDEQVDVFKYRNQVSTYVKALAQVTGAPVHGALVAL